MKNSVLKVTALSALLATSISLRANDCGSNTFTLSEVSMDSRQRGSYSNSNLSLGAVFAEARNGRLMFCAGEKGGANPKKQMNPREWCQPTPRVLMNIPLEMGTHKGKDIETSGYIQLHAGREYFNGFQGIGNSNVTITKMESSKSGGYCVSGTIDFKTDADSGGARLNTMKGSFSVYAFTR